MTRQEIYKYWYPAMKTIFDTKLGGSTEVSWAIIIEYSALLEEALGAKHYTKWCLTNSEDEKPLPEEVKHKLMMLAGPHGKTIFKAMVARRK